MLILPISNQNHWIGRNIHCGKTNKSFAAINILANTGNSNQFPTSINRVNMDWLSPKYICQNTRFSFYFFNIYLKKN